MSKIQCILDAHTENIDQMLISIAIPLLLHKYNTLIYHIRELHNQEHKEYS